MSSAAFPGLAGVSSIDFVSTNSKKDLQSLSAKGFDFVCYEKKVTYFLMQMDQKSFGDSSEGGLFAILKGKPELTSEDFILLS